MLYRSSRRSCRNSRQSAISISTRRARERKLKEEARLRSQENARRLREARAAAEAARRREASGMNNANTNSVRTNPNRNASDRKDANISPIINSNESTANNANASKTQADRLRELRKAQASQRAKSASSSGTRQIPTGQHGQNTAGRDISNAERSDTKSDKNMQGRTKPTDKIY